MLSPPGHRLLLVEIAAEIEFLRVPFRRVDHREALRRLLLRPGRPGTLLLLPLLLQRAAALFGHTHVPVNRTEEGVLLLNPGSIGYGGTYALLTEKDGKLSAELKEL